MMQSSCQEVRVPHGCGIFHAVRLLGGEGLSEGHSAQQGRDTASDRLPVWQGQVSGQHLLAWLSPRVKRGDTKAGGQLGAESHTASSWLQGKTEP